MTLTTLITIAITVKSTTYGWGNTYCGDYNKPRPCSKGAITASGEVFDPALPTAAIAAPKRLRLKPRWIWLRYKDQPCQRIRINDKMNQRYINKRGFDLTPAAVRALTGDTPTSYWSGNITKCEVDTSVDKLWDTHLTMEGRQL